MSKIQLSENLFLGKGADRSVYCHPDFSDRCIKLANHPITDDFTPEGFRDSLFLFLRRGNRQLFDYNYVDVRYAANLEKRGNPELFNHIPRCYGEVDTNLGRGVVWEKIVNYDGSPSKSLKEIEVMPEYLTDEGKVRLWNSLNEFFGWQVKHAIMLREQAWINSLVKQVDKDTIRIYHIDAIGCVDLFPLADYFQFVARLRARSKAASFKKRVRKHFGPPSWSC